MFSSKGSATIYALPGQSFKITGLWTWVEKEDQPKPNSNGGPDSYDMVELTNGFVVDDPDTGDITAVANEPAVIYTQKKFGPNKIYYYALTGERATVDVASVPIHDHSSIVSGGPAYGTYFTDDETIDGGS